MKIGEVAGQLGISQDSVRNWTERSELTRFFSAEARKESGLAHRQFTRDDLNTLNTIRKLRNEDNITNWNTIAEHLELGERVEQIPITSTSFDDRVVPVAHAEQTVKASVTEVQLREAYNLIAELHSRIEQLKEERAEERRRADDERERVRERDESDREKIRERELNYVSEIASLKAEIKFLRQQMEKDDD